MRTLFPSFRFLLTALGLGVLVAACGGDDRIDYFDADIPTLYDKAFEFMEEGQYRFAAVTFDEVERQHPYSIWARRAQLMSAYNHYLSNDYDSAILTAQRFLALHPGNSQAPYAFYLISVSYYEQISDVERDQKVTQQALISLRELVRRYPNTEYARDARLKVELTMDHLAGKEMEVGRFYMRHREYLAAVKRFQRVIKSYDTTTHVPEALHRLVEANLALGLTNEAQKAAGVLGYNFPDSEWYRDSYALLEGDGIRPGRGGQGWWSRTFDWF